MTPAVSEKDIMINYLCDVENHAKFDAEGITHPHLSGFDVRSINEVFDRVWTELFPEQESSE